MKTKLRGDGNYESSGIVIKRNEQKMSKVWLLGLRQCISAAAAVRGVVVARWHDTGEKSPNLELNIKFLSDVQIRLRLKPSLQHLIFRVLIKPQWQLGMPGCRKSEATKERNRLFKGKEIRVENLGKKRESSFGRTLHFLFDCWYNADLQLASKAFNILSSSQSKGEIFIVHLPTVSLHSWHFRVTRFSL